MEETDKTSVTEISLVMLKAGMPAIVKSIGDDQRRTHTWDERTCGYSERGGRRHGWIGGCGFHRRLLDMGIVPGTVITRIKSAAMGGPVEVEIRGTRLILGRQVAATIMVEVVS